MKMLNIKVAWNNKVLKKISTNNSKQINPIVKNCKLITEFKFKKISVLIKFIELKKIKIFCKRSLKRRWWIFIDTIVEINWGVNGVSEIKYKTNNMKVEKMSVMRKD